MLVCVCSMCTAHHPVDAVGADECQVGKNMRNEYDTKKRLKSKKKKMKQQNAFGKLNEWVLWQCQCVCEKEIKRESRDIAST